MMSRGSECADRRRKRKRLAVASQNRRQVTGHVGCCCRFWVYEAVEGRIGGKHLLELPKEQSFHESPRDAEHPLDAIDVLIAGGMGQGLRHRLASKGIEGIVIAETDPDAVVCAYLAGTLECGEPEIHGHDACRCGGEAH